MTTRLKGLTVAFDHDVREDDAEAIISAIRMLRGVLDVAPVEASSDDWVVQQRVRHELGSKLLDVVYPERNKK